MSIVLVFCVLCCPSAMICSALLCVAHQKNHGWADTVAMILFCYFFQCCNDMTSKTNEVLFQLLCICRGHGLCMRAGQSLVWVLNRWKYPGVT